MNDKNITELFFSRNEKALSETKKKYGGLCFSIAQNILHSADEAEECVNDALFSAWNSIPPNRPEKLSSYLAAITRNNALNRFERETSAKRGALPDLLLSDLREDAASCSNAEQALDAHYAAEVINKYLHSLPKPKAAVFILRYHFFFSENEICEKTGYSYSKVTTMLHRMRKELKDQLKKEGINV